MYEEQGWMDDILMADAGHAVNFQCSIYQHKHYPIRYAER